ncbi:MAG: GNAT family N-acetyltransferase [Methanosarcinales archaeon]|nr:GNAT family N-acetyltransferase [Methanosarcinales archaeon]
MINTDESIVRRLMDEKDLILLKEIQESATEFKNNYPKYEEWLDRTLDLILKGDRTAFGVFIPTIKNEEPIFKLIGSVILKKGNFSNSIELKNLYIQKSERNKKYGTKLYEEAERFCSKEGRTNIITNLPSKLIGTTYFLFKQGFYFLGQKPDKFKEGHTIYELSKNIISSYTEDPFDAKQISKWILKNFCKFNVCNTENIIDDIIEYTLFNNIFEYEMHNKKIKNFIPKCGCYIIEDGSNVDKIKTDLKQNRNKYPLLMVFYYENVNLEIIENICKEFYIPLLTKKNIETNFQKYLPQPIFPFKKKDISGMIISINNKIFNRIKHKNCNSFVYFKGGVGKFLKSNMKIYIFVEGIDGQKGIIKIKATLKVIEYGKPTDVWNSFENDEKMFTKDEYKRFTKKKSKIIGMKLLNLQYIEDITWDKLKNSIIFTKSVIDSAKSVIDSEIGHTYLNKEHIDLLEKYKKIDMQEKKKENNKNNSNKVLIITVTDIEKKELEHVIKKNTAIKSFEIITDTELEYMDVKNIGKSHVTIVKQPKQGGNVSQNILSTAIDEIKPDVVIMVGIAYGLNENTQKIGDVLISESITNISHIKKTDNEVIQRGETHNVDKKLLMRFDDLETNNFNIFKGNILSASILCDDKKFINELKKNSQKLLEVRWKGMGLVQHRNIMEKNG